MSDKAGGSRGPLSIWVCAAATAILAGVAYLMGSALAFRWMGPQDVYSAGVTQVPDWDVVGEHHLSRTFRFPNFVDALAFVNRVGALAEEEGHHPDICFTWGRVRIEIHTHKIDGLTASDFILAAKIDRL